MGHADDKGHKLSRRPQYIVQMATHNGTSGRVEGVCTLQWRDAVGKRLWLLVAVDGVEQCTVT